MSYRGVSFLLFFCLSLFAQDSVFYLFQEEQIPVYKEESIPSIIQPNSSPLKESEGLQLNVNGEKSVTMDVNQGLGVTQGLILDINGQIDSVTQIQAFLSDQERDLEVQQYSGSLREFDQVYFKITNPFYALSLGDIVVNYQVGIHGRWKQNLRGVDASLNPQWGHSQASIGTSKSLYTVVRFQTNLGQQGGYNIESSSGRIYSIRPGSERVFLDGVELISGVDYEINYFEGQLNFLANRMIQDIQQVEVRFEFWEEQFVEDYSAISQTLNWNKSEIGIWRFTKARNYNNSNDSRIIISDALELDSLRSQNEVYYELKGEIYQKKPSNSFNVGDTLYLPIFLETNQGSYRVVNDGVNIEEQYYEFVGNGNGLYDVSSEQEQNQAQEWRGAYGQTDFMGLNVHLEVDQVQTTKEEETNSQKRITWEIKSSMDSVDRKVIHYRWKGLREESGFQDFNQEDGGFFLWNEWDLARDFSRAKFSLDEFEIQIRPSKGWINKFEYQDLSITEIDSSLVGSQYEYQMKYQSNWIQQENSLRFLTHQMNLSNDYHRKQIQSKTSILTSHLTPSFELVANERGFDSLFQENKLKPSLSYRREFDNYNWSHNSDFEYREVFLTPEVDSLTSYQFSESIEFNYKRQYQLRQYFNWTSQEEMLYEKSKNQFWLTQFEQSYWNEKSIIEGESRYELENTNANFLIPIYQRVPEGSGNVQFDSLTQSYVTQVERGDYRIAGWVNDSTQADQLQERSELSFFLRLNTAPLFQVKEGFLAYSQLGWRANFFTSDTARAKVWIPEWKSSKHSEYYESGQDQEIFFLVDDENHSIGWWRRFNHQFTNGIGLQEESELSDLVDIKYSMLKRWKLLPQFKKTNHINYGFGYWDNYEWRLMFSYERPWGLFTRPFYKIARGAFINSENQRQELQMDMMGLEIEFNQADVGISNLKLQSIQLNSEELPFALTQGYSKGDNFEINWNNHIKMAQGLYVDFNYLLLWSRGTPETFQRLLLEARAVF